jgi:hypothetical protein
MAIFWRGSQRLRRKRGSAAGAFGANPSCGRRSPKSNDTPNKSAGMAAGLVLVQGDQDLQAAFIGSRYSNRASIGGAPFPIRGLGASPAYHPNSPGQDRGTLFFIRQ